VVDKSFMAAMAPEELSWTVKEKNIEITEQVKTVLPAPDLTLDQPCSDLKVMHKRWHDADVYFLFNEIKEPIVRAVTLKGTGTVQQWVTRAGRVKTVPAVVTSDGKIQLNLAFEPYESKLLVIGPEL
jgi:hypothetical protein